MPGLVRHRFEPVTDGLPGATTPAPPPDSGSTAKVVLGSEIAGQHQRTPEDGGTMVLSATVQGEAFLGAQGSRRRRFSTRASARVGAGPGEVFDFLLIDFDAKTSLAQAGRRSSKVNPAGDAE